MKEINDEFRALKVELNKLAQAVKTLKDAGVAITKIDKSSYADSTAEILNRYVNKTPLISEFYEQVKAQK